MQKIKSYLKNISTSFKNVRTLNLVSTLKLEKLKKPVVISILLGLFFFINLILAPIPLRLDLSKGQAYTLSNSSKKIIRNLDKNAQITFYVSSELPTRLLPLKSEVMDLLEEYDKASNKVVVNTVDPKKDERTLKQVQEAGIPELQFSQVENDKYAVTAAYFGILVSYNNKTEAVPQVTDVESLEYNLTSSVYKLSKTELPQVGIMGFDNLTNPQADPIGALRGQLSRQFTASPVTLTEESKQIPASHKALLIFDTNTKEYTNDEINAIKVYLKNKGKAIFFVDGVWIDGNLQVTPSKSNLGKILTDYGIKINNDLVLSFSAELVNFGNDVVSFMTPYPMWLKTSAFSQKTNYFSNVNQLVYPWVSSLSLEQKPNITTTELVKTAPNSWTQKNAFILNPQEISQPNQEDMREFMISAEAKTKEGTHIVVIPSSRFVQNQYISQNSGNLSLILNFLNVQASEGALSGINQRAASIYPIPVLSSSQQDMFKYGNIVALPIILALYGAYRLFKRRSQ